METVQGEENIHPTETKGVSIKKKGPTKGNREDRTDKKRNKLGRAKGHFAEVSPWLLDDMNKPLHRDVGPKAHTTKRPY